ncbi:unnamed protein product [Lactuca virosa]|uniref:BHLH domain-containing protein n=1 Tax=Lactuca virosa TaxID=75947 RepID=A0AAU9NRI9_9ASTR|nr:unnamed protein product [Lactuca virosa]
MPSSPVLTPPTTSPASPSHTPPTTPPLMPSPSPESTPPASPVASGHPMTREEAHMEVATIDWNDSKFEKDELYEDINAPQWIDFSANHPHPSTHDDDAWFCRPDCNHPKSADDFFTKTISNPSKISMKNQDNIKHDSNTTVKKRGTQLNKISRSNAKRVQDCENQNPNLLRSEKKADNSSSKREESLRKLKSTFSARNLFTGNNILNQITEFCNELKRLGSKKKEKGDEHREKEIVQKKSEVGVLQQGRQK